MTKTQLERISYIALAVIALLATAAIVALPLITGVSLPLFLILPLVTSAALAIWQITRLVDYDSPAQLKKFREEAQGKELTTVHAKHGGKMFSHGIPLPEEFKEQYPKTFAKETIFNAATLHTRFHNSWYKNQNAAIKFEYVNKLEAPDFLKTQWEGYVTRMTDSVFKHSLEEFNDLIKTKLITTEQKAKITETFANFATSKKSVDTENNQETKRDLQTTHTQYTSQLLQELKDLLKS